MSASEPLEGLFSGVRTALTGAGHTVLGLRVDKVHCRPGAETSVGLVATTDRGEVYLVATDADLHAGPTIAIVESEGHRYALWLHPHDPHLPGLAIASDPGRLERSLREHGVDATIEAVTFLAYRPMRRAVLRAVGSREFFIKVVRPSAASRLLDATKALGHVTPIVHDLGAGIVAYDRAAGEPLVERLARDPQSVTASAIWGGISVALNALPPDVLTLPRRPSWTDRRGDYATHAIQRGMDEGLVRATVEAITAGLIDEGEPMPTHGDLHLANVWISRDEDAIVVTSLIDVDTVGPGVRADDYGCLIAHVAALEALDPAGYATMPALARDLADEAVALPHGEDAHLRAAAVLLSLASTSEEPDQAAAWLRLAHEFATTARRL